jgi:hypothetical protein
MKIKLMALLMVSILAVPATYTMNNEGQNGQPAAQAQQVAPAQEEQANWIPAVIRNNRGVQAALVAGATVAGVYTFGQSVDMGLVKRILLNSRLARDLSLATWNLIYDNFPNIADWIYFNGLI